MEYVVIVGYFAVLLSVGAAASRRVRDLGDFLGKEPVGVALLDQVIQSASTERRVNSPDSFSFR